MTANKYSRENIVSGGRAPTPYRWTMNPLFLPTKTTLFSELKIGFICGYLLTEIGDNTLLNKNISLINFIGGDDCYTFYNHSYFSFPLFSILSHARYQLFQPQHGREHQRLQWPILWKCLQLHYGKDHLHRGT